MLDAASLVFSRGFVFGRSKDRFRDFVCVEFAGGFFHYHPSLDVRYLEDGEFSLLLAGTFFDVRGAGGLDHALKKISQALKCFGGIYDEVDFFSGRYIIIYKDKDGLKLMSDATGMKSIFYTKDFKAFSSHCKILVELGYGESPSRIEEFRSNVLEEEGVKYKYGYPGFYTPYEDCFILPPNFEACLSSKKIARFFPREMLDADCDANDVAIKINGYMRNQLSSILSCGKDVYCSLTAGLDSRFTLSASSKHQGVKYFTYKYPGNHTHESDANWASIIADGLGLDHKVINIDDDLDFGSEGFKSFSSVVSYNSTYNSHAKKISYAYYSLFGEDNYLIRSNLYEIGRAFYHPKVEKGISKNKIDLKDIDKMLLYAYDERLLEYGELSKVFSDYVKDLPDESECGYSLLDLFYWEHRMGVWHSQVVSESDPAFETLVLCNARAVIKLLLSLPLKERKDATLFYASISQYLPDVKDIPVNKMVLDGYDTFHVVAKVEGNKLVAKTFCSEEWEDPAFAFYVYRDGKKIDMLWYGKRPFIEYELELSGVYSVRGFVKSGGVKLAKSSRSVKFLGRVNSLSVDDLGRSIPPGRVNFVSESYVYESYFKPGVNSKLVVLLNGAVGDRKNVELPVFQRNSWSVDLDDHVVNINDPTLYLDEDLRLGWYYGTSKSLLVPDLSRIVLNLASALGVKISDIVVYGSSGGGFAALMISSYIGRGVKAVAINPQVYISKYVSESAVSKFYEVCVSEVGEVGKGEFPMGSAEDAWRDCEDAKCLIYQNRLDGHHYNVHFSSFLRGLGVVENNVGSRENILNELFDDPRGHVGESRKDFKRLVGLVRGE